MRFFFWSIYKMICQYLALFNTVLCSYRYCMICSKVRNKYIYDAFENLKLLEAVIEIFFTLLGVF